MRYAIYFAADSDDRLMKLGNSWLGRDPFSGETFGQPEVAGLTPERFGELTASPRRYGFHGTLKAPFFLRDGRDETALAEACRTFAAEIAPFEIREFGVNRLGRFLALTPNRDEPDLKAFAGLCVRRFEPFRAPASEADLERRRKSGLTPKQDAYMSEWGYPYIFDEFHFHMTLSEKLENDTEADLLKSAAEEYFAEVTGRPRICCTFGLYAEPEAGGPFHIRGIYRLTGGAVPLEAESQAGTAKENA